SSSMRTADYSYRLPPDLIAQSPLEEREGSRLMVVRRGSRTREHGHFRDLVSLLPEGALLILNNSKVIPALLQGGLSDQVRR
ncbi:MAG: S-adenosylmethionine:tRNA ribosyltransferase-isomerase, partial [Verrucomicrobiales bacterium]